MQEDKGITSNSSPELKAIIGVLFSTLRMLCPAWMDKWKLGKIEKFMPKVIVPKISISPILQIKTSKYSTRVSVFNQCIFCSYAIAVSNVISLWTISWAAKYKNKVCPQNTAVCDNPKVNARRCEIRRLNLIENNNSISTKPDLAPPEICRTHLKASIWIVLNLSRKKGSSCMTVTWCFPENTWNNKLEISPKACIVDNCCFFSSHPSMKLIDATPKVIATA